MKTSPTKRSLDVLRKAGWTVAVVEHWNQWARVRQDLFGFIDIVAIRNSKFGVLAVQATSGTNVAARVAKIESEPRAVTWLAAGNKIEVHGWRKVGRRGEPKRWECRVVTVSVLQSSQKPQQPEPAAQVRVGDGGLHNSPRPHRACGGV